jgi:transposase
VDNDSVKRTAGIDLGDKWSHIVVLDGDGEVVREGKLRTTHDGFGGELAGRAEMRVVLEAGTHSPWVSRLLQGLGHEVVVANPRRVQLIARSVQKRDQSDAETLARLGRMDVRLLHPVVHRSRERQEALAIIRARRELVEARTGLVNHVRGATKALGLRLPACDTRYFARQSVNHLEGPVRVAQLPLVETTTYLEEKIHRYDQEVERLIREQFPEARLLQQVPGVGPLTALTYVLVIGDPTRFRRSREVAAYLGLVPGQRQSGERDPQLGITKQGDSYLRSLLVECANYIVSTRCRETDLKHWATARAREGDRNHQRRTKVAVARKLAVLLHRLWVSGEVYQPIQSEEAAIA